MRKIQKGSVFLTILIVLFALICAVIVIMESIPYQYSISDSPDEIKAEILSRATIISDKKNKTNIVALTPFMWDEGYYIDSSVSKEALENMTDRDITYQPLDDSEQRMLFYYKGQLIADIVIDRNGIDFDMVSGAFDENGVWLNIEKEDSGVIRLYP